MSEQECESLSVSNEEIADQFPDSLSLPNLLPKVNQYEWLKYESDTNEINYQNDFMAKYHDQHLDFQKLDIQDIVQEYFQHLEWTIKNGLLVINKLSKTNSCGSRNTEILFLKKISPKKLAQFTNSTQTDLEM